MFNSGVHCSESIHILFDIFVPFHKIGPTSFRHVGPIDMLHTKHQPCQGDYVVFDVVLMYAILTALAQQISDAGWRVGYPCFRVRATRKTIVRIYAIDDCCRTSRTYVHIKDVDHSSEIHGKIRISQLVYMAGSVVYENR